MPEEPGPSDEIAGQRELLSRLRAVVEAKDAENALLRRELDAERELRRRLELRLAELEGRLSMDSSDSGMPSSKERIGAKQARRARQQSERERRKDRKRGGQPGHQGKGLARDPDPDENKDAEPPAQCRRCGAGLDGAQAAGSRWAQVIDVQVIRKTTEWALPGLECSCCGTVTFAEPPPGAHAGSVSYGAVLNAAAVVLTAYGNVPPERAARVMAMLLGVAVSPGWVDKAGNPLSRDAVSRLLTKYVQMASTSCPGLKGKTVSPHTLRHSAAMALVHVGIDPTVIALWMGHASPLSTRPYLHADMQLKQQAADRLTPPGTPPGRYHAPDDLLAFLANL